MLIELLLGAFTLVVALVTMLSAITYMMTMLRDNNRALLAKTALKRRMEWVRTQSFTALAAMPQWPLSNAFTEGLGTLPGATGLVYVCSYNPTTAACDAAIADLKQVTVTVSLDSARTWQAATLVSR